MNPTTKTSTMRKNGIQVTDLKGNQTMYSSANPFLFGKLLKVILKGDNGRYTVIKPGQHAGLVDQPFSVSI